MQLIGINGFKRSGKNTVFEIVQALSEGTVDGVGFADKLKIMAARALGHVNLTDEEAIALMDLFKERGRVEAFRTYPRFEKGEDGEWLPENIPTSRITGRQYLQYFGGEARKVFGDTFWIDQVLPQPVYQTDMILRERFLDISSGAYAVAERYPGIDYLCITDVRYPNEAERIKNLGGVVWEVKRIGLSSDGHDSEQPLPEELIDWTIYNDSDLTYLRSMVIDAMNETGVN